MAAINSIRGHGPLLHIHINPAPPKPINVECAPTSLINPNAHA